MISSIFKPYNKKARELELGVPYAIQEIRGVYTKYEIKKVVDLEEATVFLPSQFQKLNDDAIEQFQ